jgi:hypothetical protein
MLTRITPTLALASCRMHHCAQLGDQMPTRSPVCTPRPSARGQVDLLGQLPPAVAQALMAHTSASPSAQRATVASKAWPMVRSARLGPGDRGYSWLTHGCPFLWLFWARLKQREYLAQIYVYVKVMMD